MARDDEADRPAPTPSHAVGEPLGALSVEELGLRIALLREEIARLEAEVLAKRASRSAAEGFFKP